MVPDEIDAAHTAVALATAMTRLRARLRSESRDAMTDLSISQLTVLARIAAEGPITASAIAVAEHLRPPSIAEILPGLKAAGLVVTGPDPKDGRKVLIEATAAARRLLDAVMASREAWLARAITAAVTPDEARTLAEAIQLVNRLIDWQPGATQEPGWRS
jgi:DNA-binding MarR family transcriptional regulator